jgi:hypothetical protein
MTIEDMFDVAIELSLPPNAAHHPTPGQQDTLHLQVPSLAQNL